MLNFALPVMKRWPSVAWNEPFALPIKGVRY
jgi:hypothetical protein